MELWRARLLLATTLVAVAERGGDTGSRQSAAAQREEAEAQMIEDNDGKLRVFTNNPRMSLNANAPPVVLTMYFSFRPGAEMLRFKLPPGYEMFQEDNIKCGIYTLGTKDADPNELQNAKDFHAEVNAESIIPHVKSCQVKTRTDEDYVRHGEKLTAVQVLMLLEPNVEGLSKDNGASVDGKNPWWCFAMHVRNPKINPYHKDNWFSLHHWSPNPGPWDGETSTRGHDILGDWECKYSDWQGWGECNSRCGIGETRLTRRILLEPPSHKGVPSREGMQCPDIEKSVECNTFDCKFPCELVELPSAGVCSSECGGGVKAVRPLWRGDGCPARDDKDAVQLEQCNPEPCRVRCKLADTWTVVTPCSEPCGPGTYRMMRQVLEKDKDDTACQPEWREVPCVRSWCTPLSIIRPDRNILPYPEDTYYVGIAFKLLVNADQITLSAPGGYKFGEPGTDCWIHDHDLVPYYRGCKVGIERRPGTWSDEYSITLLLDGLLPKSDAGRYHFMIPVTNPKCDNNDYRQVLTVEDQPWFAEVCNISPEYNQWVMRFRKEILEDGKATTEELTACGYDLHNPKQEPKRHSASGSKDLFAKTTNANQFITSGMDSPAWRARQIFCSPRLEPCPGGKSCPPSGVCPPYDELGENPDLMDTGDWEHFFNGGSGQAMSSDLDGDD
jgi:hypothetical protein